MDSALSLSSSTSPGSVLPAAHPAAARLPGIQDPVAAIGCVLDYSFLVRTGRRSRAVVDAAAEEASIGDAVEVSVGGEVVAEGVRVLVVAFTLVRLVGARRPIHIGRWDDDTTGLIFFLCVVA